MLRSIARAVLCLTIAASATAQTSQTPWRGQNLQYFPKDISRDELIQRMREFSFALGVRCQYCHAGGNGISFEGVSFPSDEKPAKIQARAMLRMVDQLNTATLPQLPSHAQPHVTIDCATCHHGLPLPKSLQTTLLEVIDKDGVQAAVTRYRELRGDTVQGRYNFGEWEMNELARRLTAAGKTDAAIAMLELNGEFNPKSADIDLLVGDLYRKQGDREKAAQRYKTALEKAPENAAVKQRLADLEKKPR
jgi:photosynthetic reaction center cytochrome c subunit/tetratricopeptide repeat protein